MEKFLFILGKNWRLSLAEIDTFLKQSKYSGLITDYSANVAVVEFDRSISLDDLGDLMVRLGSVQKIGRMYDFVDRDTVENAFPTDIEENRSRIYDSRELINKTVQDVIHTLFPEIQDGKFFVANSIYPQAFNSEYYKEILVKHFLHYLNKLVNTYLKDNGAKKAIYFRYPEKNILSGNLNPIFPHHFFTYKLYKEDRVELLYCLTEEGLYIGRTITVVDSNFQKQMDEKRPFTEFRQNVPPKFAKTLLSLLNLTEPLGKRKILDPFCGTGTIPQFAQMLGIQGYGSDIEKEFVKGSRKNLIYTAELMQQNSNPDIYSNRIRHSDIKDIDKIFQPKMFDGIATEPVLLPFYHHAPSYNEAKEALQENVLPLYEALFEKALILLKSGARIAIVSPIIETKSHEKMALPIIRIAENQGFRLMQLLQSDRLNIFTQPRFEISPGGFKTVYDSGSKYVTREFCVFKKV